MQKLLTALADVIWQQNEEAQRGLARCEAPKREVTISGSTCSLLCPPYTCVILAAKTQDRQIMLGRSALRPLVQADIVQLHVELALAKIKSDTRLQVGLCRLERELKRLEIGR